MTKTAESPSSEEAHSPLQLVMPLAGFVRRELRELVHQAGLEALAVMLEQDRLALCGPAYVRGQEGPQRAGSTEGMLTLGGRRVKVRRPRVRDAKGEVELPSWRELAAEDPLVERMFEQMVVGVATRKYAPTRSRISTAASGTSPGA